MLEIKDKFGLIDEVNSLVRQQVTLDIGCGSNKKDNTYIGIDKLEVSGVDIVGDVLSITKKLKNNTVDKIYASHFLEHIENLEDYLEEFSRILKKDGLLEIIVPHFSNPYFYSDPTHKRFFGLYTMCYFAKSSLFKRTVPVYDHRINFVLLSVDLNFKSSRPFYIRYLFKKFFGILFGTTKYMKEFWEENLSFIFPCYEIRYILRKIDQ